MWHFRYLVDRQEGENDVQAISRARVLYPGATIVHAGRKTIQVFVRATLSPDDVAVLTSNPMLLAGSAMLAFVEDADDLRRWLAKVDAEDKGKEPGKCDCPVCRIVRSPMPEAFTSARHGGRSGSPFDAIFQAFGRG